MIGFWRQGETAPAFHPHEIAAAVERIRDTAYILHDPRLGQIGVGFGGTPELLSAQGGPVANHSASPSPALIGILPPLYPEWLGDRTFSEVHNVRFPYIAGEMANGIATPEMVIAIAKAGMLGFLGCAGLSLGRVQEGLATIQSQLGPTGASWGANLIHSPNEPQLEEDAVSLFLARGVRRISASAFFALRPSVVRYAYRGLFVDAQQRVVRQNHVFAKVSRAEVARAFMQPAPGDMLEKLVASGDLTADEARLGASLPVAEDITAEADSGGHTDNRPLTALMATLCQLRDEICQQRQYARPIRIGAAGGLGTPAGVAAAFSMGAAYVLTGSVNQSTVEAGVSPEAKAMLAKAEMTDVTMAPAADMFELGVKVQVLKRGTMFSVRGARLYDIYKQYPSLDALPVDVRNDLEKSIFRRPIEDVWNETRDFWETRAPEQAARAKTDPKHRMALMFRWYLGKASRWAIVGEPGRAIDFQLWCGPAMGAFNDWARGTFLEQVENRTVAQIGLNFMEGAAVILRAQQFRTYGVAVPDRAFDFRPRVLSTG